MAVNLFHRTRESTDYMVLTHIGVRVKPNNILYPPMQNEHQSNIDRSIF